MRTIDQLVSAEVHYCVSGLVSTLSGAMGDCGEATVSMRELSEQAFELCCPINDYEEAATEAGAGIQKKDGLYWWAGLDPQEGNEGYASKAEAAFDFCTFRDIEPYQRDVYEHWIVSDWLADRLTEHGEKVDKDFAGLTVWARTTTGQGIASDSVIAAIHAELLAS